MAALPALEAAAMDAPGFVLATLFLVAVYAAFWVAIGVVSDAVGAAWSAVPSILGGLGAWADGRESADEGVAASPAAGDGGPGAPDVAGSPRGPGYAREVGPVRGDARLRAAAA